MWARGVVTNVEAASAFLYYPLGMFLASRCTLATRHSTKVCNGPGYMTAPQQPSLSVRAQRAGHCAPTISAAPIPVLRTTTAISSNAGEDEPFASCMILS
jgi:hypothetical protein